MQGHQRYTIEFPAAKRIDALPTQFFATLVAQVQDQREQGVDLINLGQGNPDQPTPRHIVQALQRAAENPLYHKYSPFQGFDFLKQAITEFYDREYGVKLDPEQEVAVLFGGKSGLIEISQCLLNRGDSCLVPDPGYPDYWSGIALAEAEMVYMPLLEENRFLPDYDSIPQDVKQKAKLMFLNYPNNPTAAVASLDFFQKTIRVARENKIAVVHDFAYGAIGFDGEKPISFLQAAGAKEVGIEIYTLSKTYNMAGWRVAFAVGNRTLIRHLNLLQDHQFVSLFGAIQEAAAAALLGPQDCVRDLVNTYERRRDVLLAELERIGWQVRSPQGSFFVWLPVPPNHTSASFAHELLEKTGVVVAPGIGFGRHGEGYVRLGLLSDEKRLIEAVKRVEQSGILN